MDRSTRNQNSVLAWMKRNGLSYRSAGQLTGLSKDTIHKAAHGRTIEPTTARVLANAMGLKKWWTLLGDES
jgi:lambda repressor-like predicted transcriptional regulator